MDSFGAYPGSFPQQGSFWVSSWGRTAPEHATQACACLTGEPLLSPSLDWAQCSPHLTIVGDCTLRRSYHRGHQFAVELPSGCRGG